MTLKRKSFFIVTHKKYDFFFESHIDFFIIIIFNYIKNYTQYFVFCKVFVLIQPQYIVLLIYAYENVYTIIIVGEVRGKETLDMVQAMSTGHDGSLSTGHGNSPKDMMTRLETMILMGIDMPVAAIRQQLTSAIDIIIHLGRLRDKTRRVLQIAEVVGVSRGEVKFNKLFEFAENAESNGRVLGELKATGNKLVNTQKMYFAGYGQEDNTMAG